MACSPSPELAEEKQVANNILKCALQARTNAQLLSVSIGGIRALSREDALKARGEILEAIRRLQAFEKELAKKIDDRLCHASQETPWRRAARTEAMKVWSRSSTQPFPVELVNAGIPSRILHSEAIAMAARRQSHLLTCPCSRNARH